MTLYQNKWRKLLGGLSACAFSILLVSTGHAEENIIVKEIGSMHVGGGPVTLKGLPKREIIFSPGAAPYVVDPNGTFETGQMYVQYVKLANPKARYPLLLWHGGGLTGVTWETKPDGNPGWKSYFLNKGHDVYVSDAVERGRASWSRYPEIYKTEPFFRTKAEAWTIFRIGPEYSDDKESRVSYNGSQFPVGSFDQMMKQAVPRWATNNEKTQAAYDALVEKVCPCVILAHSQASNFAFTAALNNPEKVKAVIAVEPSGNPSDDVDITALKDTPFLFVWGDFLNDVPLWVKLSTKLKKWQDRLIEAGVSVDIIDLPGRGINGNTHMLMMDENSDVVADEIQKWVLKKNLMN